jgi:hypothetical protein
VELVVEVRDANLQRIGVIPPSILTLSFTVPLNNVGTWRMSLPADALMAEELRVPGSGIVITLDGETVMSGPVVRPIFSATSEDPGGTVTFDGVSDAIHLADRLAYPQPSNANVATQSVDEDRRSGPAESLLHQYVNANIGPAAPVARRIPHLVMGTNLARGVTGAKAARFPVLGELLGDIALVSNFCFDIVQRGSNLVFETKPIRDLTKYVRLDVRNNTLAGQKLTVSAPEITRAVVAGKHPRSTADNGVVTEEVVFLNEYTTTESAEAETTWSRRIERFVSQTSTENLDELRQAGNEALAEKGFTAVSVEIIPNDGTSMRFGRDYTVGDKVSVTVDTVEYTSVVTGFSFRADKDGTFLSASLGDPADFDPSVALRKRVQTVGRRLSALERNG